MPPEQNIKQSVVAAIASLYQGDHKFLNNYKLQRHVANLTAILR